MSDDGGEIHDTPPDELADGCGDDHVSLAGTSGDGGDPNDRVSDVTIDDGGDLSISDETDAGGGEIVIPPHVCPGPLDPVEPVAAPEPAPVPMPLPAPLGPGIVVAPAGACVVDRFSTPFGDLRRYGDNQLVAHYTNHDQHGKACRLTRSLDPGKRDVCRFPSQVASKDLKGRCIGFMYAWLQHAHDEQLDTQTDHVRQFTCTVAERARCRDEFNLLLGGSEFAQVVEPAVVPGQPFEPGT